MSGLYEWNDSIELVPEAVSSVLSLELIVPNIPLLKFYPHVMQFLCSFVLVYFCLLLLKGQGHWTGVNVLVISFVTSTVCLAPSGERQTVWAGPGNSILPTFMTSVSLGVPERGRAMWTRYLSEEGSWICYLDLITVTKIPDQQKPEEEFMLVSSLRDTVHHGKENMAAEAWSIWPLFTHSWEDRSNKFWCLVYFLLCTQSRTAARWNAGTITEGGSSYQSL